MNKKKKSTNTSPYPDEVIDRLAQAFYPAILACWNSEEGQREFAAWQAEQAHHTTSKEKQSVPDEERPVVHIAVVCGFWQGASGWAHPVFLLCFIIFHAQHPVSYTNMSLDQMRRIRASFQFFAQGCHVNSQGSNVIFLRTAPYFLRERGMRQHFAHIMRQYTQQFVLDGGQMQFILAQPDAACREIDL